MKKQKNKTKICIIGSFYFIFSIIEEASKRSFSEIIAFESIDDEDELFFLDAYKTLNFIIFNFGKTERKQIDTAKKLRECFPHSVLVGVLESERVSLEGFPGKELFDEFYIISDGFHSIRNVADEISIILSRY